MSKICFAVLHYGNHDVTEKCVQSILDLRTKHQIQVLIIDNDSKKKDEDRFEYLDIYKGLPVEYLTIRETSGFSGANNQGYRYIKEHFQPDFIVMTNNDISFLQRDFCDRLVDSYNQHSYDVLGPDIISEATGEHQNPIDIAGRSKTQVTYTIVMNRISLALFPLVYPLLKKRFIRTGNSEAIIQTDNLVQKIEIEHRTPKEIIKDIVPCGACLIFGSAFIEKEDKAFYPETEFYYEEYILHERCHKKGMSIIYDPSMWILHGDGLATKRKTRDEKNKIRFMLENIRDSAIIYRDLLKGTIKDVKKIN